MHKIGTINPLGQEVDCLRGRAVAFPLARAGDIQRAQAAGGPLAQAAGFPLAQAGDFRQARAAGAPQGQPADLRG